MAKGSFMSGMQGFMALHSKFQEQDYAAQARRRAHEREAYMMSASPTGLLGDSRLATFDDVKAIGLDDPRGLMLGAKDGRMLFYNGEGPVISYLRTGGGKGVNYVLTNLAHVRDRSLVVIDVKDGENFYASHRHRSSLSKCVVIDPFVITGCPEYTVCINPLQRLIDIVDQGGEIDTEADEISIALLPEPASKSGDSWVRKGAIRLLSTRMRYCAMFQREDCTLSGLWRFLNSDQEELSMSFAMMTTCGHDAVERRAKALQATMEEAPKQFEAYKTECIEAVAWCEPNSSFARATDTNTFDFKALKHEKHSVYIVLPSEKIAVAGAFTSLIIQQAIEEIAKETGPLRTTFILDEIAQLNPINSIPKALQLYRGRNVQLWFITQGRHSMRLRWPEQIVKEFEDQAAVMTFGFVQDGDLIKDIGVWSGTTSVVLSNKSYSGGTVESANAGLSETKRDLLQPEDIYRASMAGKQIIRVRELPYMLLAETVAYYTVDPWKHQILDTRLHHTKTDFNGAKS